MDEEVRKLRTVAEAAARADVLLQMANEWEQLSGSGIEQFAEYARLHEALTDAGLALPFPTLMSLYLAGEAKYGPTPSPFAAAG